jgi:hypothetical protein
MAAKQRDEQLRNYDLPLRGRLLLACGKCQRKLKHGHNPGELVSLKKLLKQQREHDGFRLRLLKVPCLKMCPKDGVTVCTPEQVARHECSILYTVGDVATLYQQYRVESQTSESGEPKFAAF